MSRILDRYFAKLGVAIDLKFKITGMNENIMKNNEWNLYQINQMQKLS